MIFETDGYDVFHSVRGDFWELMKRELKPGEKPAVAALGPIYDVDPAESALAPFVRSAQGAGLDPESVKYLAPEWVMDQVKELRQQRFSSWEMEALDRDWRDAHDWTRAGLVLELSSRIGIPMKGGFRTHVKWKMRGTVTGRFGVEQGSFNPLVIAKDQRSDVVAGGAHRTVAVLDFRAMDLCSILSLATPMRERYAGATDLHARTAEIVGLDRDEAKRELFVYTYGGRSRHHDLFESRLPELKMFRGTCHEEATANAQLIQRLSSTAFKAGLSRALPLLLGSEVRPMFSVHDELTLDVLSERLDGAEAVAMAMEAGASERMGVPYSVGVKFGRNYAEGKG